MFSRYIQSAMRHATYEILSDDGTYYGGIPGLQGVWANANTLAECQIELQEVLEDWLMLRIADHLDIPVLDGISLNYGKTTKSMNNPRRRVLWRSLQARF